MTTQNGREEGLHMFPRLSAEPNECDKRKTRENVGTLWKEMGDLVTRYMDMILKVIRCTPKKCICYELVMSETSGLMNV